MFVVKRSKHNPILTPIKEHPFESFATFNGNPIKVGKNIILLYRAQSLPETFENNQFSLSVVAKAESKDGIHFKNCQEFITPSEPWERYGMEDPRVTKINGKYFIFYTALSIYPFRGDGIKVGLAISKDMKTVSEKHFITPFNAKAMTLFPEKINGKYTAMLTVNTDRPPADIALVQFEKLEDMWSQDFWKKWYANYQKYIIEIPKHDVDHVEIGATPLKTKEGWLLVYSHIRNYFSNDKIFGIEALLLDLKNPQKVIGKTRGPLLIPEESYERYGQVGNVIFPSGAMIKKANNKNGNKEKLLIYYGATDTTCAVVEVPLAGLLESMKLPRVEDGFKRIKKTSLLVSRPDLTWEAKAIFNPAVINLGGRIHILYRAMSNDNTSVIGYAEINWLKRDVIYRSLKPIYTPRESFEEKRVPGGNSGCEDPRLTKIGQTIYMYYTAYNGITPPSVVETHISERDFLAKKWNWSKPVQVTRDGVDDKDGCLHPEKVTGPDGKSKFFLFHRVNNFICGDFGETPFFKERNNFRNIPILLPRPGMWDSLKVGISVPPIKTKKGWIILYHGVSSTFVYRIGAALLDLKDPTKVLSRTTDYIFEPLEDYEKKGQVDNVVFPCGAVLKNGTIYMYYGGGDKVIDDASINLKKLLDALTK